jgi:large subunit ribosomal protein L4e
MRVTFSEDLMIMAKLYDLNGTVAGDVKLPRIFSYAYRPEVIKRAVLAAQASRRQRYGANPLAGKRTSAHYHGKRKYRFTMMNREMARIARIHGKVGYMAFRARFVPQAVKGRKAHPPNPEKIWSQKINKKENVLAVKSSIAATADMELVKKRGHAVNEVPIIFVNDFENISKSRDVKKLFEKLFQEELDRCSKKKVRAGKGHSRGRPYKRRKGPLVVVSQTCPVLKAARNLPGVDVSTVNNLSAELLAPGSQAGRFTIFTKSALEAIEKRFGE